MTRRRIIWMALVFALLVQAAWAVAYLYGCCGGIREVPEPPIALPHVLRFGELGAQPLAALTGGPAGDWRRVPGFAATNAIFWLASAWLLLHGIVLLCRVRLGRGASGRRLRLVDRAEVRPLSVAVGALLLLGLILGAGAVHRRWWLSEAQRVLHASIAAARTGGGDPPAVALTLAGTPQALHPSNFAGNYAQSVDPRTRGKHPLDTFAAPMVLTGTIQFPTWSRYQFNVRRQGGGWTVSIWAPCTSEAECLATIER
jgi:hypothetical protein